MSNPVRSDSPAPWAEVRSAAPGSRDGTPSPKLPSPLASANTTFWWPNEIVWVNLIFKSAEAMQHFTQQCSGTLKGKATISEFFPSRNSSRCLLRITSKFDCMNETLIALFNVCQPLGPYLYNVIKNDLENKSHPK